MDLYNIKEIGKSSRINDEFWKESHGRRHALLIAVEYNNDEAMLAVLKDPKLFKGRS